MARQMSLEGSSGESKRVKASHLYTTLHASPSCHERERLEDDSSSYKNWSMGKHGHPVVGCIDQVAVVQILGLDRD